MARIALAVTFAVAGLFAGASPALACSSGLTAEDVRRMTDVFILGRVTAVEIDRSRVSSGGFAEALVIVRVDVTFKGAARSSQRFVDNASALLERDPATGSERVRWAGGTGACGTIDQDPVGSYIAIALRRGDDGRLYANRLLGAAYGKDASDTALSWLLERHGFSLPNTSTR